MKWIGLFQGGGSVIAAAFFEPTGLSEGEKEVITHERCINSTNSRGISIRTIEQTRIDEKDKVTDGFSHLVGNVFRFKASYLSNHQCVWPYGRDVAGFVVNANAKKDIEGNPVYSWKCIEVDDYFDYKSNRIVCAFSHRDCSGTKGAGKQLCESCTDKQYKLYDLFRKEVTPTAIASSFEVDYSLISISRELFRVAVVLLSSISRSAPTM